MNKDMKPDIIAQTDEFIAYRLEEPDGEITYHLDLNNVTLHFFTEEWDEFMELKDKFINAPLGKEGTLGETDSYGVYCEDYSNEDGKFVAMYSIELPGVVVSYFEEDFKAFCELVKDLRSPGCH